MATLTNIPKNRYAAGAGGEVFYGFMFLFTRVTAATGPVLTNIAKHSAALTNIAKS